MIRRVEEGAGQSRETVRSITSAVNLAVHSRPPCSGLVMLRATDAPVEGTLKSGDFPKKPQLSAAWASGCGCLHPIQQTQWTPSLYTPLRLLPQLHSSLLCLPSRMSLP
ncbi:hypothetical protein J4Q44_G00183220 [Coregonus suidteri]|uniref:Uncharacterized protein n=1 Tax=Coregonus suidteri TaxID=861788 RepID=A0AAN8R2R9_9TELE